jgi:hypothetical protein
MYKNMNASVNVNENRAKNVLDREGGGGYVAAAGCTTQRYGLGLTYSHGQIGFVTGTGKPAGLRSQVLWVPRSHRYLAPFCQPECTINFILKNP